MPSFSLKQSHEPRKGPNWLLLGTLELFLSLFILFALSKGGEDFLAGAMVILTGLLPIAYILYRNDPESVSARKKWILTLAKRPVLRFLAPTVLSLIFTALAFGPQLILDPFQKGSHSPEVLFILKYSPSFGTALVLLSLNVGLLLGHFLGAVADSKAAGED